MNRNHPDQRLKKIARKTSGRNLRLICKTRLTENRKKSRGGENTDFCFVSKTKLLFFNKGKAAQYTSIWASETFMWVSMSVQAGLMICLKV